MTRSFNPVLVGYSPDAAVAAFLLSLIENCILPAMAQPMSTGPVRNTISNTMPLLLPRILDEGMAEMLKSTVFR